MVFSSSVFLFIFLPVVLGLYFIFPSRKVKNYWILVASLFFYAWGEPVYIVLMLVSIVANWLFALAIGRTRKDQQERNLSAKAILIVSLVFNIAVIGFFKYEGFLAENLNLILGSQVIPNLELPLPIGISFYTLQALSYVVDVYRGEVPPQRNVLFLGMYISCFPQLIAGPIVRYKTIQDQVLNRQETLEGFTSGMRLFVVGLAKKALLANTVAILATKMLSMGGESIGLVGAWGGLIAYTFQIFFDFSGYSDMAIGLGRMMGFSYLRNFNYPYISKSITEFWRRWHISLSSFFRDYIYIPLGGSRVSAPRQALNIAVVWAITGLWHGAAWNYVLWGVYYGALLLGEKFIWGRFLEKLPAVLGHVYTIAIFVFGWSFFWITDPAQLVPYWEALVGRFGLLGSSTLWELTVWEYWPIMIVCGIASTPICPFLKERILSWVDGRKPIKVIQQGVANARMLDSDSLCVFKASPATQGKKVAYELSLIAYNMAIIVLLFMSCAAVVSGSFNPFIYFQF